MVIQHEVRCLPSPVPIESPSSAASSVAHPVNTSAHPSAGNLRTTTSSAGGAAAVLVPLISAALRSSIPSPLAPPLALLHPFSPGASSCRSSTPLVAAAFSGEDTSPSPAVLPDAYNTFR
jgi:hypothetical protein